MRLSTARMRMRDLDHGRVRARLALVATGTVAALSLSACLVLPFVPGNDPTPGVGGGGATGSSGNPTAVQQPPAGTTGLGRFYSQRLDWRSCSAGECAKLEVPVDYAQPQGSTIQARPAAGQGEVPLGSDRVAGGQPGRSGRLRGGIRQLCQPDRRCTGARGIRHRRFRPSGGGRVRPDRLPGRRGLGRIPRDGSDPGHPGGGAGVRRRLEAARRRVQSQGWRVARSRVDR